MGASSEPVRPPCLDLPSSSLQLRTCALEGGTPDRRHPRPSGVHLRLRCPCPGPVHSPQPGPALASSSSGSGSGSAGAARAARGPSPSALGAPSFPLPLPPTCYSPPELHPHWPSPRGPPQPPSGWSVSREGRGLGRKDRAPGSPAGVGGRCGPGHVGRRAVERRGGAARGCRRPFWGPPETAPRPGAGSRPREHPLASAPPPPAFSADISVRIPFCPSPTSA